MKFLVLDTSSSFCSVSLSVDNKIFSQTRFIPREHNKYLLPMIDEVIKEANIDKKSIGFVAYGVGPGSFVGVRLAASVCQAFAVSLDIPVIGFSSMFAIAKSTTTDNDKVAVILDAKMGDFYLGFYDKSKDKIVSEQVYKLDEYSPNMLDGYQTVGEKIAQINFEPEIDEFNLDTRFLTDYIISEYYKHKKENKLTHETYPVYLRGTSHWAKKGE
ncbi:tRNA (adenosine(37)-N6)-threonylcarbamoyltransferase complex dimerization subunit type 1 TsaB [Francisella frigiditurris]|uniref:tRNA threonylcarbamoyladenosine biosynthesis protein TsaB n=1 Tax=Francisella frigiditurris TaxID=1542390 RepID=A0A1J0KRG6_9GAMM|nr:tRNA (adenosine(37)-N6)-threonylcarbamoyltransferase complex dimerization subunit type 1 TsaB [Francisella frigiditurris]APC96345.1 tRNA threonylcarbamoyl adenosine modification protein YeaZ [Francisella frigiditurris]